MRQESAGISGLSKADPHDGNNDAGNYPHVRLTERDRYEEQIHRWYEQVIDCKGNAREKNAAYYMLVSWHMRRKEYEKAQQMLDLLPEQDVDKRILQARLLAEQEKTDEAAVLAERKLVNALNEIQEP